MNPVTIGRDLTLGVQTRELVRLDYDKQDISLLVTSEIERERRALTCAKEPWTVDWLERYVREGDVLYDVGANVGVFSLIAARQCGAHVYAFEPGYANYSRLCDNIVLNGCDDTIVALPFALSDRRGLSAMRYRSVEPGGSRHRLETGDWTARKDPDKLQSQYRQPICAFRMDDAMRLLHLPAPVHVKIDVDGAEDRVLRGGLDTLNLASLRSILIEVERGQWDAVTAMLAGVRFTLRDRYDRENPGAPIYGLFIRSS